MKKFYNEIGKEPPFFQCCKCKWEGEHKEKDSFLTDAEYGKRTDVCPKCGHEYFYGINYIGKSKSKTK